MPQKLSKPPSRYELLIEPEVHEARARLPGHVRQRIKRAISDLAVMPEPAESSDLDATGLDVPAGIELRRLRLDAWRIVYAISAEDKWVWVLAIHRRPPYDYQDLRELATKLR